MEHLTRPERILLESMFMTFIAAADRCLTVLNQDMEDWYKQSQEYQKFAIKHGKVAADMKLHKVAKKELRHADKHQLKLVLETAKILKTRMDKVTYLAISLDGKGEEMKLFDHLQHDSNFLCRLLALIINCIGEDDEIKIESTIKILSKGDLPIENLIERFRMKQNKSNQI